MSSEEDRQIQRREAGEKEAAKLWRAWKTAHQMVQDRGYNMLEEEVNISLEEFRSKFCDGGEVTRSAMHFSANPSDAMIKKYSIPPTAANPNPPSPDIGSIYVSFIADTTIGIKHMRTFIQEVAAAHHQTGILVTNVPTSSSALKLIPTVKDQNIRIETFVEQDLLVNITHHELVPKHVLLSREERTALLQRYRLKDTQLPRIQSTDPVARYLGLRKGQVVKIIRKSETAGRYASYRLCV